MQPEEIQREMQQVRTSLGSDMRHLAQQARDSTDWRHYVRRYPWFCLGAVAATGYLLVPSKKKPPVLAGAAEFPRQGSAASAQVGTGAGITSAITAMVVRAVASAVMQRGMDFLNRRKQPAPAAAKNADGSTESSQLGDVSRGPISGAEPW